MGTTQNGCSTWKRFQLMLSANNNSELTSSLSFRDLTCRPARSPRPFGERQKRDVQLRRTRSSLGMPGEVAPLDRRRTGGRQNAQPSAGKAHRLRLRSVRNSTDQLERTILLGLQAVANNIITFC